MAHYVNARYDSDDNMFLPPLRTIGFNPHLQLNDHLLVQSYIETYDISYPEALQRIEEQVAELKQHLENEGEYELTDLGVLRYNEDSNYEFIPCEAGILTPSLYGLGSFEMKPLSELPEETKKITPQIQPIHKTVPINTATEKTDEIETDAVEEKGIVIRMSWLRNTAVAAIALLLFLFSSTPVTNSVLDTEVQQSSIMPTLMTDSNESESSEIQDKSIAIDQTVGNKEVQCIGDSQSNAEQEDPEPAAVAQEEPSEAYTIVLASQTPLSLAEVFISQLAKMNISGAKVMKMNNTEKVRVIYGTYASETEARNEIRKLHCLDDAFYDAFIRWNLEHHIHHAFLHDRTKSSGTCLTLKRLRSDGFYSIIFESQFHIV